MTTDNSMDATKNKLLELWHKTPQNIVLPLVIIFFTVILVLRDKITS